MKKFAFAVLVALAANAQQDQGAQRAPDTVRSTAGAIRIERLATLEFPWGLAFLPDGRLLITEKPGRLRIWANGALSEPVRGVPRVAYRGQGGLLDVAVDPNFATNRYIYLYFTEAAEQQSPDLAELPDARFSTYLDLDDDTLKGGAVARAKLDGDQLTDLRVIWRQIPKTIGRGHFGGRLLFARDGKLLITSGERMRFEPAQSTASNLGKIVRINPDGTLPSDNPFAGQKEGRGDIWSLGHRNNLAAAIHPASGDLWTLEMGPLGGDELNIIAKGKNYGWPAVSDGDNYDSSMIPDSASSKTFEKPVRTWTPVISPSGMIFYDGALFPSWRGDALAGGLSSMSLIRLTADGRNIVNEERIRIGRRIRDVEQARDGALFLIEDYEKGSLLRLTPAR